MVKKGTNFHRFGRDDEDSFFILRHLPETLEQFSQLPPVEHKKKRKRTLGLQPDLEPTLKQQESGVL